MIWGKNWPDSVDFSQMTQAVSAKVLELLTCYTSKHLGTAVPNLGGLTAWHNWSLKYGGIFISGILIKTSKID